MPSLREVVRLSAAMVDIYCASYPHPPGAVTLDIDDTATSRPVTFELRSGKTSSGRRYAAICDG